MKYILLVLFIFININVSANNNLIESQNHIPHNKIMVGGWYPVFFDNYDEKRINALINVIKSQNPVKIVISYIDNQSLANKIKSAITSKVRCNLIMEKSNVYDDLAQFDNNKVVIIVYNKI